ncbi:MAG: exopolyphosphatase [Bacteroidota bacterium]
MKIAVIDMGTNTFHLLIAEVNSRGYDILIKERQAVKVGEKGINKGEITTEAWHRAITCIKDYREIIDQNQVSKVFSTATSAIRNASNGIALTKAIEEETGIKTAVISGSREAELILVGVKEALDLGLKKNLIMDIGGGSIEFMIANQEETFWIQSFEMGGQRLIERFHKNDPILNEEIHSLNAYFDEILHDLRQACKIHLPKTLIGCSGTFDTLSDIYCEANAISRVASATEQPFEINSFEDIYQQLLQKNREERLAIPGMADIRVDMIVVASVLIRYLIDQLAIDQIRVSSYALKEGILFDALNQMMD